MTTEDTLIVYRDPTGRLIEWTEGTLFDHNKLEVASGWDGRPVFRRVARDFFDAFNHALDAYQKHNDRFNKLELLTVTKLWQARIS